MEPQRKRFRNATRIHRYLIISETGKYLSNVSVLFRVSRFQVFTKNDVLFLTAELDKSIF